MPKIFHDSSLCENVTKHLRVFQEILMVIFTISWFLIDQSIIKKMLLTDHESNRPTLHSALISSVACLSQGILISD